MCHKAGAVYFDIVASPDIDLTIPFVHIMAFLEAFLKDGSPQRSQLIMSTSEFYSKTANE